LGAPHQPEPIGEQQAPNRRRPFRERHNHTERGLTIRTIGGRKTVQGKIQLGTKEVVSSSPAPQISSASRIARSNILDLKVILQTVRRSGLPGSCCSSSPNTVQNYRASPYPVAMERPFGNIPRLPILIPIVATQGISATRTPIQSPKRNRILAWGRNVFAVICPCRVPIVLGAGAHAGLCKMGSRRIRLGN